MAFRRKRKAHAPAGGPRATGGAAAAPQGGGKAGKAAGRRPAPLDLPFLVLVLALVAFGLVMLFSASYAVAMYRRGNGYAFIRPQLLFAAIGIAAMYAASRVDYHIYHKLAWPMLGSRWCCWCWCFYAGIQRLQALDRAAGPWDPAAQRDR